MTKKDFIAVVDFGSQYNQLIARRVREAKVYCELFPYFAPVEELLKKKPKGIILSGGPRSVYEQNAPSVDIRLFKQNIPVLGICYGMHLMAKLLGGKVAHSRRAEYGRTELFVTRQDTLFEGLNPRLICWMSHGDIVYKAPKDFITLARTPNSKIAAMACPKNKWYAVQFHIEVSHTPWGIELVKNFLYRVCGAKPSWTMGDFIDTSIKELRRKIGKHKVICALSGGVDSTATAALVSKAVGKQLTCVFVNHGFLRDKEARQVRDMIRRHFNLNLVYVNASSAFLKALKGVTDPEEKRVKIGNLFIKLFEKEARKIGDVKFLAQGTLYPDIIESRGAGTISDKIKTHHNVGGLPERMQLTLIEPLRILFKDEVRSICQELDVPEEITFRHPFPGPGLAIRIIGEVTRERLQILRKADVILLDELKKHNLYTSIWQAFAVLPAVRTVGVMGDKRTYAYPIVIRCVTSEDGMTADWARLPHDLLERISSRIINEIKEVNRVGYDISSKPPATIEWE